MAARTGHLMTIHLMILVGVNHLHMLSCLFIGLLVALSEITNYPQKYNLPLLSGNTFLIYGCPATYSLRFYSESVILINITRAPMADLSQ